MASCIPTPTPETAVQCPGCLGHQLSAPWIVPGQPAVLNYRCHTVEVARRIPLQSLHLVECSGCGLIFNAFFDESLVPYDEGYENRQSFSTVFLNHMDECVRHLAGTYPSSARDPLVVEPGCGKGAFLQMLCQLTGWRGIGYDTTCEVTADASRGNVRFVQHYVGPQDIDEPVHAIVCRHVIEHVRDVRAFLGELHGMAVSGSARVVYIETPSWEWIVESGAFWDVFHEHCNYFTLAALRRLAERAGFHVLEHLTTFGGQYQSLYLGLGEETDHREIAVAPFRGGLQSFARESDTAKEHLRQRLDEHGAGDVPYAIWGAGAKGATLANTFCQWAMPPSVIIDCNPGKTGAFIPGVGIPVHAPEPSVLRDLPLIVVPNPNYLPEIKQTLHSMGLNPTLISV